MNLLTNTTLLANDDWFRFTKASPENLIPFIGYMLGVMVIAVVAHRYLKKSDGFESEYYVGNRSFGAWVLAMSWVATMASGGSFVGYPSRIFSYGWSVAFWVSGSTVTALVGLGIVGKRINRLARQTGALTLVDLIRDRFQTQAVGAIYAIVVVVVTSVYMVAQFGFGARILESMLGTSYEMGLILFTISVVAYTTYGGFRAVAWTDTMQGIVMIVGIVLLVPLALWKVGSLEEATLSGDRPLAQRQDPESEYYKEETDLHSYLYLPGPRKIESRDDRSDPPEKPESSIPGPWLPIGMGLSLFMARSLGGIMMPTTVPRMLAFKDTKALRRAILILAPYILLLYGCSLITMNCAHSLNLGLSPEDADLSVTEVAKIVAPGWMAGILIAAPFAAVMSTVDSALLVISASVVRDLIQKTWRPDLSQTTIKRLSYAVTAATGVAIFLMAFRKPTFLQPLIIHYVGSAASALLWPSLATLFWKRATAAGVTSGMIGGLGFYALAVVVKPFNDSFPMHPFVYGVFASAVCLAIGSWLTRKQPSERLELFFGRMTNDK